MKIVKIFKTDVQDQLIARHIAFFIQHAFSHCRVNFDLEDCDKILRIESQQKSIEDAEIQLLVTKCGYYCEPLQD